MFGPNRRRRRNSPHKGKVLRLAAVYCGRVWLGFYVQGVIKGIPKLSRALVAIEKDVMMLVSTVRSMALLVLPLLLASPAMGQAVPGAPLAESHRRSRGRFLTHDRIDSFATEFAE